MPCWTGKYGGVVSIWSGQQTRYNNNDDDEQVMRDGEKL